MSVKHKNEDMEAIHAVHPDGEHHAVAILNLHVLIVPAGKRWYAHGLEIDYAAQGDSVEAAKLHFQAGFKATIYQNLKMFGNIDKFLRVSPNEVWREYFATPKAQKVYTHVSMHEVIPDSELVNKVLQFDRIEYAQAATAATA
jgi:hypothetical protein